MKRILSALLLCSCLCSCSTQNCALYVIQLSRSATNDTIRYERVSIVVHQDMNASRMFPISISSNMVPMSAVP